jgi:hypothetical protein
MKTHVIFVTVDEFLFNANERHIIGKTIYAKNQVGSMLARGSYRSVTDEKSGAPIIRIDKVLGKNIESIPNNFRSTECFVEVNCIPVYPKD